MKAEMLAEAYGVTIDSGLIYADDFFWLEPDKNPAQVSDNKDPDAIVGAWAKIWKSERSAPAVVVTAADLPQGADLLEMAKSITLINMTAGTKDCVVRREILAPKGQKITPEWLRSSRQPLT